MDIMYPCELTIRRACEPDFGIVGLLRDKCSVLGPPHPGPTNPADHSRTSGRPEIRVVVKGRAESAVLRTTFPRTYLKITSHCTSAATRVILTVNVFRPSENGSMG